MKAELDKAKNDVARAYADTENMKKRLQKDADATRKYRFQQQQRKSCRFLIQGNGIESTNRG